MKKRKILSVLLTVSMIAGLFSGCASSENGTGGQEQVVDEAVQAESDQTEELSEKTQSSNDGEKKKVVLWTWATGQFDAVQDAYFESHPDADWEFEEVVVAAEDYLTKLQQGYASGGDMPDLLMAEMGWRGSAFALDIWENLEEAPYNFDRSILLESTITSIVNANDQVIGVENGLNPAFMMYKKDLARKYLGTDDREELEKMFQTYEDYAQAGARIYEESGGSVTLFPGLQDISNMMMQQQRNINNVDENGDVNVTGKVEKVFETVENLRESKACGNLSQYSTEWSNAFADGTSIFFPGASWSVTFWVEPYDPECIDNWGMFTPAEGGFGWGGTCYGIYKNSDMKEEAWDFISWVLLTSEGAKYMKEGSGFFLPVKSLYEDPDYTKGTRPNFGDQEINTFMMEEIAPNIPEASLSIYDNLVSDSVNMVVQMMAADPGMSAADAMEEFKVDLQAKIPDVTIK